MKENQCFRFVLILFVLFVPILCYHKTNAASKYVIEAETGAKDAKININVKKRVVHFKGKFGKASSAYKAFSNYKDGKKVKINKKIKFTPACKISGELKTQKFSAFLSSGMDKDYLLHLVYFVKNGKIYKVYAPC